MKSPTNKEKISKYEEFLHKINMFCTSCNNDGIKELINNADSWSYSHRSGEFVTDNQRQKMIDATFWKLCDTPEADKSSKERQKAYTQHLKKENKKKLFL